MDMDIPASEKMRRPCERLAISAVVPLVVSLAMVSCRGPEGASLETSAEGERPRPANPAEIATAAFVSEATGQEDANPLDADRAYGYLKQICDLGPRPTGSPGMLAQQKLLVDHFQALGGEVLFQKFQMRHPRTGKATPVANLVVQWHPDRKERIVLCAHYDTRPQPDNQQVSKRQRGTVFIGANDGGSGTALLMELGHHIPSLENTAVGVDFVFFDAEEFIFNLGPRLDNYFVGSTYFAKKYVSQPRDFSYRWGVLFDMVGDKQLQIFQERNSWWWRDTRPLVKSIWATAKKLEVHEFVARRKHEVQDDHVPLRNIGKIPSCNIIDFDYPKWPKNAYWHTEADTLDKCSGESLAKVGWVILVWLEGLEPSEPE